MEKNFEVYDMNNMKKLQEFECSTNRNGSIYSIYIINIIKSPNNIIIGVCALSPHNDRCFFAYPSEKEGTIVILDGKKNKEQRTRKRKKSDNNSKHK